MLHWTYIYKHHCNQSRCLLTWTFFHTVIPPFCVSPSFKSINVLLFDYIIASYPMFLTMLIYLCIEFHDRQHTLFPRYQLKNCFKTLLTSWNPKRTILNTFATFLLLSYSKLLFTSICLLLAFQSHNIYGEKALSSPLLLYNPTIRFFTWTHSICSGCITCYNY